MKKITALLLAAVMFFASSATCVIAEDGVSALEESYAGLVGVPEGDAAFSVRLEAAQVGGQVVISASLEDVTVEGGIVVFDFGFFYDTECLALVYDETDFDSDTAFHPINSLEEKTFTSTGKVKFVSEWESLSILDAENGYVRVRYLTPREDEKIVAGDTVAFLFVFDYVGEEEGVTGAYVPCSSVSCSDYDFNDYKGAGSYAAVDFVFDYETIVSRLVGAPSDDAGVTVDLALVKPEYHAGATAEVTATVNNLAADAGVNVIEFMLFYDTDALKLNYDETDVDSEGAFHPACTLEEKVEKNGGVTFDGNWESITLIDAENGFVHVKYITTDKQSSAKSGEAVFTFRFTVEELDIGSPFAVLVPNASVCAVDYEFNEYHGNGSYVIGTVCEEPVVEDVILEDDSAFKLVHTEEGSENPGFIRGVEPGTDLNEFLDNIVNSDDIVVNGVKKDKNGDPIIGTGATVTCGENVYLVVVPGDLDGDGDIKAVDYAMVKRSVLRTYTASDVQILAGALTNGEKFTAADYAKIKRHVLGTYKITAK